MRLPQFLGKPYRNALRPIAGGTCVATRLGGRRSLKSAAHDEGRSQTRACGARAIKTPGAQSWLGAAELWESTLPRSNGGLIASAPAVSKVRLASDGARPLFH